MDSVRVWQKMRTLFEHLDPDMLEISTIPGVLFNLLIPIFSWISVICD